jgi:hypothetical protein
MSQLSKTVTRWTGNIASYGIAHAGCFVMPVFIAAVNVGSSAGAVLTVGASTALAVAADTAIQRYAPTACRCTRNSLKRIALQIALPAMLISSGMHVFHHHDHEHEGHDSRKRYFTDDRGQSFMIQKTQLCYPDGRLESTIDTIPISYIPQ